VPAGAEGRVADCGLQLYLLGPGQVQQRVGVRDRQGAWPGAGFDDRVPGMDAAFGDDPHVEAGPVVGDQQGGHLRLSQPQSGPVAGDARLGDLELRLPDLVSVPDAHLVVCQPVYGQVLPEHAVSDVVAAEVPPPVPV